MLIEFHIIQDHGPSNMNRGRDAQPKTAFYAGTLRLRVSSQCRKRTLRQPKPADGQVAQPGVFEQTVGTSHFGVRTRLLPEKVAERWREQHGDNAPFLEGIKSAVSGVAKKDGRQDDAKADGRVRTPQAIYLELDREVERIVTVLNELHDKGELKLLADESQVFGEHLKNVAEQLEWQGKDPSKTIAWDSVKANWSTLVEACESLDLPDRPEGFDPAVDPDALVPTFELASALLRLLTAVDAENPKDGKKLRGALAPPRGAKPKAASKISLADLLKRTVDRPISAADIALFGRMTTSDAFRDVEAACQVADAISTHPVHIDTDFFTAVDDLDTGSGAAHMGDSQFASAVFYQYLSVDYNALLSNLGAAVPAGKEKDAALQALAAEARTTAQRAVEGLLRAIMLNVPSGKINSHAHHQQPSLILVEVKQTHAATSYLTAFHEPARGGQREDGSVETLLTDSVRKLLAFARYRDEKMRIDGTRRFLFANDEATEKTIKRLRASLQDGPSTAPTDDGLFAESSLTECETFEELVSVINRAVAPGGTE